MRWRRRWRAARRWRRGGMGEDEEKELFARALEASAPEVKVPEGFAEVTAALGVISNRRLGRATTLFRAALLIGAAAVVAIAVRLLVGPADVRHHEGSI